MKTAAEPHVKRELNHMQARQDATMRSRRLTQTISGSNDEVGRTAYPRSKLKTWTEDTTMTEDKQCLQRVQRDTTELKVDVSRRGAGRTCLMIVCSHVVW